MRNLKISAEDALALSTREESHFFDRKAIGVSGKSLQKCAVAFANADGGEICVGVADDNHQADPELR